MKKAVCFLNGRYVDTETASISALDRGFLLGEGLFETWRTYRGRPFAVAEHLARMARSARILGIAIDRAEDWGARTVSLAKRNGILDRGVAARLTLTRGSAPLELLSDRTRRPTRLLLLRSLAPGLARARSEGVSVHLMPFGAGVHGPLRRMKSLNYLPAILGRREAAARGHFEALYRLDDGTVLEGTTTNVFVLKGGRLITTPVEAGIMPGITRSIVARLASRLVPVEEGRIKAADLLAADELFLTSSTIEIVPVIRVGRRRAGAGRVGELTRELQRRYRLHVARKLEVEVDELGD